MRLIGFAALVLVHVSCKSVSSETKDFFGEDLADGQTIFAEALLFQHAESGNDAYVIDMAHIAPQSFYDGVTTFIVDGVKAKRGIVLEEAIHCDGRSGVAYEADLSKFNPQHFAPVKSGLSGNSLLRSYLATLRQRFKDLVETGFLRETTCGEGGLTPNQRRWRAQWREDARQHGLALQPEFFRSLAATESLTVVRADVNVSAASQEFKVISAVIEQMVLADQNTYPDFFSWLGSEASLPLQKAIDYYIMSHREQVLMSYFQKYQDQRNTRFFLPWGAAHSRQIYGEVEKSGYRRGASAAIKLGTCKQMKKTPYHDAYTFCR